MNADTEIELLKHAREAIRKDNADTRSRIKEHQKTLKDLQSQERFLQDVISNLISDMESRTDDYFRKGAKLDELIKQTT